MSRNLVEKEDDRIRYYKLKDGSLYRICSCIPKNIKLKSMVVYCLCKCYGESFNWNMCYFSDKEDFLSQCTSKTEIETKNVKLEIDKIRMIDKLKR